MIPLSRLIAYKTAAMQAHLPHRLGRTMRGLPPQHCRITQSWQGESAPSHGFRALSILRFEGVFWEGRSLWRERPVAAIASRIPARGHVAATYAITPQRV